jgi:hypothetical protein
VDVLVLDSTRGTEAAGFSETDGSAMGCIIVAPTALEGILQKQGLPINRAVAASGNTVIPHSSTIEGYREAFEFLIKLYNEEPMKFASYQAVSVRLSRILEAVLPAAEALRQYNRAVIRKENPLFTLQEIRQRIPETEKYLWSPYAKVELLEYLSKSSNAKPLQIGEGARGDLNAFVVRLENGESILLGIDQEPLDFNRWGEKKFETIQYRPEDSQAVANLLGIENLTNPDLEFLVVDAGTGETYGDHKLSDILNGTFKIGIPVGRFQMLKFIPKRGSFASPSRPVVPETQENLVLAGAA